MRERKKILSSFFRECFLKIAKRVTLRSVGHSYALYNGSPYTRFTTPNDALQDPNSPDNSLVGRTIGDVVIEERVKLSRTSLLYRGIQRPLNRPVLLKLWPPIQNTADPSKTHRGIFEARILSRIRHPNVTTLYDSGLYKNRYPYIVTEYLFGGDLRTLIDQQAPLPPVRALGIIQQIASALEELHKQNIVHRNLTPKSILFENLAGSQQELIKLAGFDLACIPTQNHPDDSILPNKSRSNPHYMAPEQVLGGGISPSIDLYACGVLLYEMLTRKLPYTNTQPPKLWDEIVGSPPTPLTHHVSSLQRYNEVQNLVDQLLAKRSSARIQDPRKLRLLSSALRERILQRDISLFEHNVDAFPVLETSGHVRPASPALRHPQTLTPKHPTPPAQHQRTQSSSSHSSLDQLPWTVHLPPSHPTQHIVISIATGTNPPKNLISLFTPHTPTMSSDLKNGIWLFVFIIPNNPTPLLQKIQHILNTYRFSASLSFSSQLPPQHNAPNTQTVRAALQSLQDSHPSTLIAPAQDFQHLGCQHLCQHLDGSSQGRYSSPLMRFVGTP